ncbi:MAG: GspH/FimT family pseudopilin [Zoogloeaceae bacterium]|jgi:prepilin-type N-terminal cleavage/methylation domain-containing protein|nr:GspH/FimT family pseudopilin [Zoogloeaceae bacterium]
MKDFNKMRGFTLIELMIVVILIVIFAAFAVPSFKHRLERTKVESYTDEFLTALRYARSEAITRGTEVSLAPINATLDKGWNVKTVNFGGSEVFLREHNALNGVKICTETNDCGRTIAFTFTPRGSMKVQVDGADHPAGLKLLVRPNTYNNVPGDSSVGTALLLEVNTLGHARISNAV